MHSGHGIFVQAYWRPHSAECSICQYERAVPYLAEAYGSGISFSECEEAASLVIRSELAYEDIAFPRFGRLCHVFSTEYREKEYLGCVILRRAGFSGDERPIAEAFLRPPRPMRMPPYQITVLGPYGTYMGLLPFECTPYANHAPGRGAWCAEAALYICSVILMHRGAKVFGSFALTSLAAGTKSDPLHPGARGFYIDGLNVRQIESVVRSPGIGVSGVIEGLRLPSLKAIYCETVGKILLGYLRARLPIIVLVNAPRLYGDRYAEGRGHAIVLIGYRCEHLSDFSTLSFVFHDTTRGAYLERPASSILKAARDFDPVKPLVRFIVAAPSEVTIPASTCIQRAIVLSQCRVRGCREAGLGEWDVELCPTGAIAHNLSVRDSSGRTELERLVKKVLGPAARRDGYSWCVRTYRNKLDLARGELQACFLFNAKASTKGLADPYLGSILWSPASGGVQGEIWDKAANAGKVIAGAQLARDGFRVR